MPLASIRIGCPYTTITLGTTAPTPVYCRYNPVDHLIYVPTFGDNNVVTIDPNNSNALVVKTGSCPLPA